MNNSIYLKSSPWGGYRRVLVLFTLVVSFCSCTQSTSSEKIKIENKTNNNLICVLGYNYPDLNLKFINKQTILSNAEQFEVAAVQTKIVDTLGLCNKAIWDSTIKHSMLMLMVFDKDKFERADKFEDALTGRYYFSYAQVMKNNGVLTLQ